MKRIYFYLVGMAMFFALGAAQTGGAVQPDRQSPMSRGEPQSGIGGYPMGTTPQQEGTIPGGEQGQAGEIPGSEMLGKTVQTMRGQDSGRVVALASREGETIYIIMAKGGSEGNLIPIPFAAAYYDPQRDAVVLTGIDDERLADAPTFTLDEMEKLGDPEFERRVHGYYGQP